MPPQIHRAPETNSEEEKSDAEIVMSMVSGLKDAMSLMLDKVDQFKGEEKKHYDSLRRGLKRLKEEKTSTVSAFQSVNGDLAAKPGEAGAPYCICNYCLKRTFLLDIGLILANVVTYVLCSSCENFTLCLDCFMDTKYQHHPAHEFTIQNEDRFDDANRLKEILPCLKPGRGIKHHACCDSCDRVRQSYDFN